MFCLHRDSIDVDGDWREVGVLRHDILELARASRKIVTDLLDMRPGENLLILADTIADKTLVEATALAAHAVGSVPTIAVYPTPKDVIEEPPPPLLRQ